MNIIIQIGLLVLGFVLLMKGADWFVEGAAKIAEKFGIPEIVIGLTIVALGTSLPEASVSITSAIKGNADLCVGNVLGSNIMNVLVILGITALVCTIPVKKNTLRFEMPMVIAITVVFVVMGVFDNQLGRIEGLILWAIMIGYIFYLKWCAKNGEPLEEAPGEGKEKPMWLLIVLIIVGAACITVGSDFTVDSATALAKMAGVSERIIGLTIIALGTSLPELVTSVAAALKKKTDIAVGNIVGSNIFNILFVAGTTAVITPVAYQKSFAIDSITAIATVVLLLVVALPKKKIGKIGGIIMLLGYGVYMFLVLG